MKRIFQKAFLIVAAITLLHTQTLFASSHTMKRSAPLDHGFSVKEYEKFHDVLHPLEHEALPRNDFKRIRSKADELVTLGEAILKLGVPRGVEEKYTEDFKEELKKFGEALKRFKRDAEEAADPQLKESYSAVHDSFEMLAAMLPRK